MVAPLSFWIGFNAVVAVILLTDILLLTWNKHAPSFLESLLSTLALIGLSVGFGLWVGYAEGWIKASEFFAGYVIEYSLSVDNLFLFVLIFTSFRVNSEQQRILLLWGVIGALVMRGLMIGVGTTLLLTFAWVIYLFGAYIVYTGFNMLFHQQEQEVEKMWVVRQARRWLPMSTEPHGGRFLVREQGRLKFTLLFLVLFAVELTDLVFALDSIPAIFGVTRDPFIVYTSNVCAVLGLRSLYFLLAHAISSLAYLRYGLACILIFVGLKMLSEDLIHIPTPISLLVVGSILVVSIVASIVWAPRTTPQA